MTLTRADFHEQNQASAQAEAQRLFEQKAVLQGAWLSWVASQIYTVASGGVRQHGQKRAGALAGNLPKIDPRPSKAGTSTTVS